MLQFFKSLFKFLALPIASAILVVALYFYFDPFKVVYSYNDYSFGPIAPDRDYVSTEMYMKNAKKYNYDSFIFGSSRTLAYHPSSWVQHLDAGARPYMFDGSGESVYGVYIKLKYLDSLNVNLKNVLIVICRDVTFAYDRNPDGYLYRKHPATSGESKLRFHLGFLKAYLEPGFLLSYYGYLILQEYKPFMSGFIVTDQTNYDTITNQITFPNVEKELREHPETYHELRSHVFYKREGEQKDSVQLINPKHLFMLKEIERILNKHKTNYKVVISPLYEQRKFSNQDLKILRNIFGAHLYDFSGENKFTNDITNYYETSHYRPFVADSIMNIIYQQ